MNGDERIAEDVELIRRIGTGDRAGFQDFYARYAGLVFSTAFRVLNNESDAEEVAQDVFFTIWEKSPMFDAERGKPSTWAVTLTRNKAIDRLRSVQRRSKLREEVEQEHLAEAAQHASRRTGHQEDFEQGRLLRTALTRLSKDQREVIEMAYFGGLTQQEISEKVNEPLGTVKARMRRGMVRLKRIVESAV